MPVPRHAIYLRIVTPLVVSLALLAAAGCHRDPNVRKQKYLESGKRYAANGSYQEAAIQFTNAIKLDKHFAPAYYELAKTDLQLGRTQNAYNNLLSATSLDPSNADARLKLGAILLSAGEPERAQEQANAILALHPDNADAYAFLAQIAENRGDKVDARKDMDQALSIDPNKSNFHSMMAMLDAEDPAGEAAAEQELQKAASLDPKSAMPHRLLAEMLEKKNDLQGAEQQLHQAIASDPKDLQSHSALAELRYRDGDPGGAEQVLLQAIDADPANASAASALLDFYAATRQMDHAEQVFSGLVSKYPKSSGVKIAYARVLIDHKDYAKANAIASQLARTDAHDPQVQTLNALLLLNAGKTDDAFVLLQKAANDNPNSQPIQLLLGRVADSKGEFAAAQAAFQQVAALTPGNVEAAMGLADIAMKQNDPAALAQVADTTLKAHPNFGLAYLWRGMAEAHNKEYAKAEADFQQLLKSNSDNSTAYIELAQLRFAQGHIPEATAMVEKSLQENPNSVRALNLLAAYMAAAKQPPAKIIERVQAQVAAQPQNGHFYAELGYLQFQMKDYKSALDSSRKATQLAPADLLGARTYTQSEVALGNLDEALATWQKWVSTHPSDPSALAMLGSLEEEKGDSHGAEDAYRKTLQVDPNNAVAANNLALLMVDNGEDADAALSLAQTARRLLPDDPETADTLAWVYFHKEQYGMARDLLESSARINPNSASIHLHLGLTYDKLDDKADAIAHLKKAIALAPNSKLAVEANVQLSTLESGT